MSECKKYSVFYAEWKMNKNDENWEDSNWINVEKKDFDTLSEVFEEVKQYCQKYPNMVMDDPNAVYVISSGNGETFHNIIGLAIEINAKEDDEYLYTRHVMMW